MALGKHFIYVPAGCTEMNLQQMYRWHITKLSKRWEKNSEMLQHFWVRFFITPIYFQWF